MNFGRGRYGVQLSHEAHNNSPRTTWANAANKTSTDSTNPIAKSSGATRHVAGLTTPGVFTDEQWRALKTS